MLAEQRDRERSAPPRPRPRAASLPAGPPQAAGTKIFRNLRTVDSPHLGMVTTPCRSAGPGSTSAGRASQDSDDVIADLGVTPDSRTRIGLAVTVERVPLRRVAAPVETADLRRALGHRRRWQAPCG